MSRIVLIWRNYTGRNLNGQVKTPFNTIHCLENAPISINWIVAHFYRSGEQVRNNYTFDQNNNHVEFLLVSSLNMRLVMTLSSTNRLDKDRSTAIKVNYCHYQGLIACLSYTWAFFRQGPWLVREKAVGPEPLSYSPLLLNSIKSKLPSIWNCLVREA